MRENRSSRELSVVCFFVSCFTNQRTIGQKEESVLNIIANRNISYFQANLFSKCDSREEEIRKLTNTERDYFILMFRERFSFYVLLSTCLCCNKRITAIFHTV